VSGAGGLARRLFNAAAPRLLPRWYQRRSGLIGARLWDMMGEPDEEFYAREYLHHLRPALAAAAAKRVLDLGCGQGRLAIPLSREGYDVTAVDRSADAIEAARRYAAGGEAPVFHHVEIGEWLRRTPDGSFDAVLALEVLYMMESWRDVVRDAQRVLRPGGVCALGFRPMLYYLRYHARRGEFDLVARVAGSREGRLGTLRFNWHTSREVVALLHEMGFHEVAPVGIGIVSGIPGDPLETIATPSRLTPEAREQLLEVETACGAAFPDDGRYLLALARKGAYRPADDGHTVTPRIAP